MTDQLLQPQKQRRQVRWEEQCKEPILGINPQPQRSHTNTILDDITTMEDKVKVRPNGTIRYMYAVCDEVGRYCDKKLGRFKATVDNIILPEEGPEW